MANACWPPKPCGRGSIPWRGAKQGGVVMKVKIKQRSKRFSTMSCGCCDRIHYKEQALDKQQLKELLEEIRV